MTVFYKKQGRRYIPVSEYDQELNDAIREGTHLIISTPGKLTRRYNVDPSFAPMIAAGIIAEDAISDVIMKVLSFTPERPPVTPEQKAAWVNYRQALRDFPSTVADARLAYEFPHNPNWVEPGV